MLNKNEYKNEFDPDFWSTLDTLEKCYYLGFLTADGYVKTSDNTLGVDLAVKDITWLVNYKSNLRIDNKILLRDQRPKYNSISVSVQKKNKKWISDLVQYGLIPNKTGKEHIPFEFCNNEKEVAAMFLGYHDGDCSIYLDNTGRYRFATYGTKDVCNQLNEVLVEYVDFSANPLHKSSKSCEFIFSSKYSAKADMERLFNFLYAQNPELRNCWLVRKHDKWASCMLKSLGVAQ